MLYIAIIGGGPAGALAGERLASAGHAVTIFDEKLAWEKPCGGGVTAKALERYRFLQEACTPRQYVTDCELISPAGRRVVFTLDRKLAIFSRRALNGLLLERASAAGAQLVRGRVSTIDGVPGRWTLLAGGREITADFLVLAAGARSSLRGRFAPALAADDLMISAGYFVPGSTHRVQIRFFEQFDGYAWTFPRTDHYSAGICGKMSVHSGADLRRRLEAFLDAEGLDWRAGSFYAHVIPSPRLETLRASAWCGPGWAMVGDAAALVDSITGEGLYYALRSGELLADAVNSGRPETYASRLRDDFLDELELAAAISERFYTGTFMGGSVIERMIQFTARSRRFRQLMCDLFAGSQVYTTLKSRVYRGLLPTLLEIARSAAVRAA